MIVVLETVCEALTVYVPVPPVPVPKAVIVVPAVIPVPDSTTPIDKVPEVTALTVNVVPDIEPVTTALVDSVIKSQPLLAPKRPYLSIIQLLATVAYPLSRVTPESWVFKPMNPGAVMLVVFNVPAII